MKSSTNSSISERPYGGSAQGWNAARPAAAAGGTSVVVTNVFFLNSCEGCLRCLVCWTYFNCWNCWIFAILEFNKSLSFQKNKDIWHLELAPGWTHDSRKKGRIKKTHDSDFGLCGLVANKNLLNVHIFAIPGNALIFNKKEAISTIYCVLFDKSSCTIEPIVIQFDVYVLWIELHSIGVLSWFLIVEPGNCWTWRLLNSRLGTFNNFNDFQQINTPHSLQAQSIRIHNRNKCILFMNILQRQPRRSNPFILKKLLKFECFCWNCINPRSAIFNNFNDLQQLKTSHSLQEQIIRAHSRDKYISLINILHRQLRKSIPLIFKKLLKSECFCWNCDKSLSHDVRISTNFNKKYRMAQQMYRLTWLNSSKIMLRITIAKNTRLLQPKLLYICFLLKIR